MKSVYFLRHGLAYDREEWKDDDALRPLTSKGMKQMVRQAEALHAIGMELDVIISSPLVRAFQTADIVARRMKLGDELVQDERVGPGFSYQDLQLILSDHPEANRILLVGHEPDLSQTVSALIGGGTLLFKKGGIARVDLTSSDPLHGELVWFIAPKWMLR